MIKFNTEVDATGLQCPLPPLVHFQITTDYETVI